MMGIKKINGSVLILLFLLASVGSVYSQKTAIKTNLLSWGTLSPNIGIETMLSSKFTLDIRGAYRPFTLSTNKTFKYWIVQPEIRLWTCESFNGTFFGLHLHGGEFNFSQIKLPFGLYPTLKDYRYEGYYYGGGLSVGHHWILSKRWSIEATLGLGYSRVHYDKYSCEKCSPLEKSGIHNYWGPTHTGLSLIYFIK